MQESTVTWFSGGDKNKTGVGMIVTGEVARSVLICEPNSERIMIMRLKMKPLNVLILQIYTLCEDAEEEKDEKEQFYERLDQTLRECKKGEECLVVIGDYNGKIAIIKEENIID